MSDGSQYRDDTEHTTYDDHFQAQNQRDEYQLPDGDALRHRMELILAAIPDPTMRLLDIGCVHHRADRSERAHNWLHEHLYHRAREVIGIDILGDEIDKLQQKGYHVRQANAESFALDGTFDCIVAGEMLQMTSNPGRMIDNCYHHQTAGDVLIISVPHPFCFAWIKQHVLSAGNHWNPNCVGLYTESTLSNLLDRHGYDTQRCWYAKAEEPGFTRLLHRIGMTRVGSTRIVIKATRQPRPDQEGDR